MKKMLPFLPALLLLLLSCKSKEKTKDESFFPVLSFIKGQVNHVDTSLYQIMKLNIIDSSRVDTEYVRREDFRELAKDFLEIPDLADPTYSKRFQEERILDNNLGRILMIYLPTDREKETVQRQEVLVTPDEGIGKMNSVIINYYSNTKDSSVEKKMLWRVDQSFQVTTITQKPGMPESITTTKVVWNESAEQ